MKKRIKKRECWWVFFVFPHHESCSRTTILREPWSMIANTPRRHQQHNELAHLKKKKNKKSYYVEKFVFKIARIFFHRRLLLLLFQWSISTVLITSRSKHSLLQGNERPKREMENKMRLASVSGLRTEAVINNACFFRLENYTGARVVQHVWN